MTDEETLHDEIDELAAKIENQIAEGSEVNEEYEGVFDPKHRRMAEASVDPAELFS